MQLIDLQISCECTQAIKQAKVYTLGQLQLTQLNFAILNSHVAVVYLRFIKRTYFYLAKLKIAVLAFFKQENCCSGYQSNHYKRGKAVQEIPNP